MAEMMTTDVRAIMDRTPFDVSAVADLREVLEQNIERMAEAEHGGWMDHRARNGWRYAEKRCDEKKLHPALLPFAQLPEREKGKDRNSVQHYPDFAARANLRIVRLGLSRVVTAPASKSSPG